MKLKVLVSASVVLGLCSAAFADGNPPLMPYSYRVQVPGSQDGCDVHAQRIANLFSQSAQSIQDVQVQNVVGSCEGTHAITDGGSQYSIDTVVVNYQAIQEIRPFQAIFAGQAFGDTPSAGTGLFADYASCLAQLSKQEAAFETETGLVAVASHCDADTLGDSTYSLTIEGFGTPKRVLFDDASPTAAIGPQDAELTRASELAITASGGDLVWSDDSHVFYYAAEDIPVTEMTLGYYPNASECTSQLADAKGVLAGSKLGYGTVLCSGGAQNATESATDTELTIVAAGVTQQQAQQDTADHYASFADCMADKPRVLQNVTSAGDALAGAICRPGDGTSQDYVLDLYFTEK